MPMSKTEYASNYKLFAAKYQAIRPEVEKWASSLSLKELTEEFAANKAPHLRDLIDIVARKKALA